MKALFALLFGCISLVALMAFCVTSCHMAWALSSQKSRHPISMEEIPEEKRNREFLWRWLTDGALLLLFMTQHSFMATGFWKSLLYRLGLEPIARALYVLASCGAIQMLLRYWEDLPAHALWEMDVGAHPVAAWTFSVIHAVMWVGLAIGVLALDVLELLGLKQVYYYARGDPLEAQNRATQTLLLHMRHSCSLCLVVILWVHPVMTLGRLLLALNWTLYLLFGHSITLADYEVIEEYETVTKVKYQRKVK